MKVFVALSQTKPVDTSIDLPPNKVLIPMSLKEWKVISRLGQVIKKSESFKGIE
jgi:hypothetical protein